MGMIKRIINYFNFLKHKKLISNSELFNKEYYIEKNPDVAGSNLSAIKHYLLFGGFEGRNPSEKFDGRFYLDQYPDVKHSKFNPLIHYLIYGFDEGREPFPANYEVVERREPYLNLKLSILGIQLPKSVSFSKLEKDPDLLRDYFPEKHTGTKWPKDGETMIGYKRLTNLEHCVIETINQNIEGDLIETGVWKGGACIFMRALLKDHGIAEKKVWVADSFEGLPEPNPEVYPSDLNDNLYTFSELKVSLDDVKKNFQKYGLLDEQVVFLKGWFKETLPQASIEKLSILRLDGDMYESTIDALFYLYPKLSIGGYCIIDDWGAIPACKTAVTDYRNLFGIDEEINEIDWTGVFWKKEKEIARIPKDRFMQMIK
jgi:hypothetical protein